MKQFMLHGKKPRPSSMVGSDAKNTLPTTSYNWTDLMGLSWVFREDYA
ncbi:hypothetical protein [Nitrosopumilus sp.]